MQNLVQNKTKRFDAVNFRKSNGHPKWEENNKKDPKQLKTCTVQGCNLVYVLSSWL